MSKDSPKQDGSVINGVTITTQTGNGNLPQELLDVVGSPRFVEQIASIAKRDHIMTQPLLDRYEGLLRAGDANAFNQFYFTESPVRVLNSGVSAGHSFIMLDHRYFNAADAKEVIGYLGDAAADVRLGEAKDFGNGKVPEGVFAIRVPDTIFRDKLIIPMTLQNGERLADRYPELAALAQNGFTAAGFDAASKRLAADGLKLGAMASDGLSGFTVTPVGANTDFTRDSGVVVLRQNGKSPAHGETVIQTKSGEFAVNSENLRRMEAKGDFMLDGKAVPLTPEDIASIRASLDMSSPASAAPQGRPPSQDPSQGR